MSPACKNTTAAKGLLFRAGWRKHRWRNWPVTWLSLVILGLCFDVSSKADVSTRVCLSDGNTPLELVNPNVPHVYRDMMVGTKLTIIVHSDANSYWGGGLFIAGADRQRGILSGRDYNETTGDWAGSRFPAAGADAVVWDWQDDGKSGFDLYGDDEEATTGDWFIIDYNATDIGSCRVGFYDYSVSMDEPIYDMAFTHVRTRDLNSDKRVDFADFAAFSRYWQQANCYEPNLCSAANFDTDGDVDMNDLGLFVDYWLESTQ